MSGEFTRSETNGTDFKKDTNDGSLPDSPVATASSPTAAGGSGGGAVPKNVEDVMYSDIGVNTLLVRLKQSIASARDFAAFLKERSTLEEKQATGLKRLAKSQLEVLGRSEVKTGTYAVQLGEIMRVHERMGDNGMQFALSLHQMHEDLVDLSTNMERGRKQWKHDGLSAEKRAADAEAAMMKAKARYDGLAEDYDRARTGDTKGGRRIGLKGPKSAEQYEQDLLRKTQAADQEYEERVKQAKTQRDTVTSTDRPKAVKALLELIKECDSALTLQLQKFATFNEKLLLGNGLAVTPLTDKDAPGAQRSMRDLVQDMDNDTDFNNYVRGQRVPPRLDEIKYIQHPTLASKTQTPSSSAHERQMSSSWAGSALQSQPSQQAPPLAVNTNSPAVQNQPGSANSRYDYLGSGIPQRPSDEYGPRPGSGGGYRQPQPPTMNQQIQSPASYNSSDRYNPMGGAAAYSAREATPPYPTHPSERNGPGAYQSLQHQQTTGSIPGPGTAPIARQFTSPSAQQAPPPLQHNLPPLRPVFGISLEELFQRDQTAVPLIVVQSILAVDTFGLSVEGIYRLSGNASHISALKSQFDHDSSRIDFRNPAAFFHDVNSVASLLKQFFKELPDPLFTMAQYGGFIEAAKIESPEQRRDALHQNINDLPDPNYATLRALVLHLHRVMMQEGRNRMGGSNLAVCFAPSLMGTHGGQIADAGLQARVLDTILENATAIFDED